MGANILRPYRYIIIVSHLPDKFNPYFAENERIIIFHEFHPCKLDARWCMLSALLLPFCHENLIDKKVLNFPISSAIIPPCPQDSYIGNTTASQASILSIRKPAVSNAFSVFQNCISENVMLFVTLSKYFAGLVYR